MFGNVYIQPHSLFYKYTNLCMCIYFIIPYTYVTYILGNYFDEGEYQSYDKNLNNIREDGNKARTEECRVRAVYMP